MIRSIKNIIWSILRVLRLAAPVQLILTSNLTDTGWLKSFYMKQSVDAGGNPLPWITYPAIRFLDERMKKDMRVFEYGSGNSSRWFAKKAAVVISVEHDKEWADYVGKHLESNAKLIYHELEYGGDYGKAVLEQDEDFHLIVIDGRDRVFCAKNAVEKLTGDGVILFDNSDRSDYEEAYSYLAEKGFRRIPFEGFSPVFPHTNETSIYYRDGNCLQI